jgi:HD-GYP domain-containing protein (c-di-GMP phosphodiesterase class II)
VQIPISTLPAGIAIPTHFFVFFAQNQALALWRHAGDVIQSTELRRLTEAKMNSIWILKSEVPKFRTWWLNFGKKALEAKETFGASTSSAPPPPPESTSQSSPPPFSFGESTDRGWGNDQDIDLSIVQAVSHLLGGSEPSAPPPTTPPPEAARTLVQAIAPEQTPGPSGTGEPPEPKNQARDWSHLWNLLLSERGRKELPRDLRLKLSRESAETLLHFAFSAQDQEQQSIAEALITETVGYFIRESLGDVAPGLSNRWSRLASLNPSAHSLRVGSWAVLIAILNCRLHRPLLAELALAGLAHDIGISTLAARTALLPMRVQNPGEALDYATHVEASCELLERSVPPELRDLAGRASRILRQHHEKFDGRGFPKGLRGFHVEESAQFLCMADLLLGISEGQWDGVMRTHRESLSVLEKHESAGNFPEFFHPTLFQSLIRSAPASSVGGQAA